MSTPKDHHFIPQFLLAPWCGEDGKLTTYTKPFGDVVSTKRYAPSAVAKQQNLYAFANLPDKDAQMIEADFLQKVDHFAARAFQSVSTKGANRVSPKERSDITLFMLSLRARHPSAVEMLRTQGKAELVAELDRDPDETAAAGLPSDKKLSEYVAEKYPIIMANFGMSLLPSIAMNPRYLDRLVRLPWADVTFPTRFPDLIIGDRACLLRGDLLSNCLLILPLGPHRALFAASSQDEIKKLKAQDQIQLVKRINRWSAEEAIDYFYATNDQHVALAKARLRKRPA